MRRPTPTALLLLGACLLVGWLVWSELESAGVLRFDGRRSERERPSSRVEDEALAADLRRRAELRGIPGLEAREAGTGRLTGAVRLHAPAAVERPLPGVTVEIHGYVDGRSLHEAVVTDEDGLFAFANLEASPSYALVIRHAPYRDVLLRGIHVLPHRATDVGSIVLGAPTVLAGGVVDHAGRPVSGATVQVLPDRSRPGRRPLQEALRELQAIADPLLETVAGPDGRFLIRDAPPGRYVLRVSAPGFATAFRDRLWVTPDERSPDLLVVLDPGAGCEGRVVDASGRGIADARVIAVALHGKRAQGLDRVETLSAPDGTYRLDSLVPDVDYFVEAWAEGRPPTGRLLHVDGMQTLDLVLGACGAIEGRILEAGSGLPVSGARVMVVAGNMNSMSPLTTVADAAGRYRFPCVSPGPVLVFGAEGDAHPAASFSLGEKPGHRVEAGEITLIDMELEPGTRVAGRVRDTRGRPVPYATVTFVDPRRRSESVRAALTGTDGAYEVEGLRPGTPHEVQIRAAGFAPLVQDDDVRVDVEAGFMELDFVLEPGATLAGRVVDPEGAPVRGARIGVEARGGRRLAERVQGLVAVSGPAGAWVVAGVPPRVELVVRAEHDAWATTWSEPASLRAGEERELVLTLGRGARLEGRVVDARGAPVAEARVRWGPVREGEARRTEDAFRADQLLGSRVVRTSAAGTFAIDRLEPGPILLKVEAEGHPAWYRRDVVVPHDGDPPAVQVELESAFTIEGRVLDGETRRGVPDAWIYARRQDDVDADAKATAEPGTAETGRVRPLVSVQTDAAGRFVLADVPLGRYEVVAWFALGYRSAAQYRDEPSCRRSDVEAGARDVEFLLLREE